MPKKPHLTVALVFVAATVLFDISCSHRRSDQTLVNVRDVPNEPEAMVAQATKYLREACPDMVVIKDQSRADYTISALWAGTAKEGSWVVIVRRKGFGHVYVDQGSDAIQKFRQACATIRDDVKELADFEARTATMPTERYVLQHSANSNRIFLLDSKTGAVWELKALGDSEEFERISVEGLYDRR